MSSHPTIPIIKNSYLFSYFPSEFLGDLFNPLCRMCPDQLGETLRATLATENFPTKYISRDSKETFVQSVLKSSHQKRRLKVIIKEFSLECRGYNNRSIR